MQRSQPLIFVVRSIGGLATKNTGTPAEGSALTFVVKAADPLLGLLFGRWDTRERGSRPLTPADSKPAQSPDLENRVR